MTYFNFLLGFVILPILVLLVLTVWDNKHNKNIIAFRNGNAVWVAIGIHIMLAVVYTTPWDNYLVATGVWYYNPKLVTGLVLGYVPIEEYTFFIVETILAGLWWWYLTRRLALTPRFVSTSAPLPKGYDVSAKEFKSNKRLIYVSTCVFIIIWMIFTYLLFFGAEKWTYLSITLFWALPPIVVQLWFGADILWHYRKLVFWAIAIPGMYLSLTDIIALNETTWSVSKTQTTGILFFGILPLEEIIFFFITNALIIFGMTLLLANVSEERVGEIKNQIRGWKEAGSSSRLTRS